MKEKYEKLYTKLSKEQIFKLLEQKDKVLSICAHELRHPLGLILGLTDLLRTTPEERENLEEYLGLIEQASETLLEQINHLLEVSVDIIEGHALIEEIEIKSCANKCIKNHQYYARKKNIQLSVDENSTGTINAHRTSIERILNNLLSNAIKFTHQEGSVSISSKIIDQKVHIEVKDSGIGIPKDLLGNILEGPNKIKRKGTFGEKSFGIGLYLVKNLVEQNRGSITVNSEEGKGTIFTICFPESP